VEVLSVSVELLQPLQLSTAGVAKISFEDNKDHCVDEIPMNEIFHKTDIAVRQRLLRAIKL